CERGIACRRYVYAVVRSLGGVNEHDWALRGCMVERLECGALDTEVAPSSGRWARLFETLRIYGEQRRVHPSRRRLRSYLSASEADPAVPPGGPRTPKIRNPSLRTGRPDTGGLPGTITAHTSRPCLRGRLLFVCMRSGSIQGDPYGRQPNHPRPGGPHEVRKSISQLCRERRGGVRVLQVGARRRVHQRHEVPGDGRRGGG